MKRNTHQLLPALLAVGGACSFAAAPANALELGDIRINSTLGQPLRASIAYALNPNEKLFDYCIYLRPGISGSGIPMISRAGIRVTDSAIILSGNTPIREPLMGLQIAADCPYTPHLVREYTLMIDPAVAPASRPVVAQQSGMQPYSEPLPEAPATSLPATPGNAIAAEQRATNPVRNSRSRTVPAAEPIAVGSEYRVRAGDTLSTIVSRIEGRRIGLWPAVDAVFNANPAAFIDNDMNRLMTGARLIIPDVNSGLASNAVPAYRPAATPAPAVAEPASIAVAGTPQAAPMVPAGNTSAVDIAAVESPAVDASPVVDEPVGSATPAEQSRTPLSELRPGDVVMRPVDTGTTVVDIPDTRIANEPAARPAPLVVTDNTGANNSSATGSWSWLMWLGGTGLALILGLLLFGRTLRQRFGSVAIGAPEAPARRRNDDPTQKNRVIEEFDLQFEDTVNAQAISLDADLEAGTGFQESTDVDLAEDFGFSAASQPSNNVDLEITAESAREPDAPPTDVIPPNHRIEAHSILESEVPPDAADEDYDLSMIVDATRQPIGEYDATAKDLHAVRVDSDAHDEGEYTLTNEIDYKILEQDYEEEFTATMALNEEIERAARELARHLADDMHDAVTAEMPATEVTAEMPSQEETRELPATAASTGSTSVNRTLEMPPDSYAEITAELTANIPTEIEAVNDEIAADDDVDLTTEMVAADKK